ncbi:DUF2202 domain-containing protein [uncultured Ilyobacter sp.]|uniref:DUF2202 domain-containing protein n=1 Tax=uncultured Ilyobacter sp. TaxID=544433 RepID=UPI0029C72BF4|nr:DUF2202 domain-containing protein [uncultured Ilyobacter sp.]
MKIKTFLLGFMLIASSIFSSVGAARVENRDTFSIREILTYSMEDELLAKAEYEKILAMYGEVRPFTSIIEAEKRHIGYLEPLLEKYKVEYPKISEDEVILPKSLKEAYEIGVKAEIANIEMYNKFLKNELPEDVREVFIKLKNASENHLRAFKRHLSK